MKAIISNDELCLINPLAKSFNRESHLNVLLYGSDEFNDRIKKEIFLCILPNKVDDNGVAEGAHGYPIFCVAKIKNRNKGKKEFQSRKY